MISITLNAIFSLLFEAYLKQKAELEHYFNEISYTRFGAFANNVVYMASASLKIT